MSQQQQDKPTLTPEQIAAREIVARDPVERVLR
jgi:hypothetical protein